MDDLAANAKEQELKAHIRNILENYMFEHILIDQASYTSTLVSNVSIVSQLELRLRN